MTTTLPAETIAAPGTAQRFAFGANWHSFLNTVDDDRIREAERSLREMLCVSDLQGRTFLDVGSGSGLFSLAAMRLGARVHSFDYDPQSVACTEELRRRYADGASTWTIEHGSVLDPAYIETLSRFDVVFSWGVLHHTGAMWTAIDAAAGRVRPGGRLFIAIYNDQGRMSGVWKSIKRLYCRLPRPLKPVLVVAVGAVFEARGLARRIRDGGSLLPVAEWAARKQSRGMSVWHDLIDWVGGYPFEVATPRAVWTFLEARGFVGTKARACAPGGFGCNEFVLTRDH